MNKLVILALISLAIVFADCGGENQNNPECLCHVSCICDAGSNVCKACKHEDIGAVMDQYKKSCPCPAGYFTSSLNPFTCTELLVPDQSEGDSNNEACLRDINMRIRDITLNTNCYFCNIEGKSYVVSEVTLNLNSVSLNEDCKSLLDQQIKFFRPDTNSYEELDAKYLEQRANGGWTVRIPLIDVFNLSLTTNVGNGQISQQIQLMSLVGTTGRYVKNIKWAICIYTNRDVVQVFQLDIDIQESEQDCVDCIVIADLETVGEVYSDDTFTTKLTAPFQYFVGDYFHAKITFKDATYTKFLKFVALYYRNDLGQIYDYSSITVHSWYDNGLVISLPLSEPSHPAMLQCLMKIDNVSGGRFLQEASSSDNQKANFSMDVQPADQANNDAADAKQSGSMILFGLVNLLVVALLI